MAIDGPHTLVIYGPGARADVALAELADSLVTAGGHLTVLSLVAQEPEKGGCCDTRSVLWNEISRDLGCAALVRARRATEGRETVQMEVVLFSGRDATDAILHEAADRGADEVVLARAPLGVLARRRLRRLSPVPVRRAA